MQDFTIKQLKTILRAASVPFKAKSRKASLIEAIPTRGRAGRKAAKVARYFNRPSK